VSSPVSARSVALEAIRRVIDEGAYSNRVMPGLLTRSGLDSRDRAFAMELAFGTLRRLIPLDAAIAAAADRPVDRITPPARHVLRLGAYQLLDAGVAPHAAVSATVDLVPGRARGFVNAVLRRLASNPPAAATGTDVDAISRRTGLGSWAVRELQTLLGPEAEAAAAALAARAPLSVRVVGGALAVPSAVESFRGAGFDPEPGRIDPGCILLARGDPRDLPGFGQGSCTVQDQASAFVVRVLDPQPGDRVYDPCAAPGGKTLHVAELVSPDGHVLGADMSATRVGLVVAQAARLRVNPHLLVQDAIHPAVAGPFDRVLVDAPCSGVGSARRRPELLWRVRGDRLSGLAARQLAIVMAGADVTRPAGRLVYAVCTFTRAETDSVCDALLRSRQDLTPIATDGPDGLAERHRLWPHRHGCDGMFVAAFRRMT
jgi:16S rRNA (cytosine967-C5)-methyltransferase